MKSVTSSPPFSSFPLHSISLRVSVQISRYLPAQREREEKKKDVNTSQKKISPPLYQRVSQLEARCV